MGSEILFNYAFGMIIAELMRRLLDTGMNDAAQLMIIREKEKLKTLHRDTLGQLYLGRRTDVVVSCDDDLKALCRFMLRLGLGIDAPTESSFEAIQGPISDKSVQNLADTAIQVATHTNKTIDMRIPHRQMMAWPESSAGAISSGDAINCRPVYGCGQSAQSLARLFWSRDFIDARNGLEKRTCIILMINDPAVQECLDCLDDRQKEEILTAAERHGRAVMPDNPGPKQVFLPVMGDNGDINDYLLVSPVLPLALVEEFYDAVHTFHKRHKAKSEDQNFRLKTPDAFVHVGGTKPQNIGDLFSSLAGRIRCLEAKIPHRGGKASLAERVEKGFDLVCLSPKLNQEAQWINRSLKHKNQLKSYTGAFSCFLFESFRLIRVYRAQRSNALLGISNEQALPLPKPGTALSEMARTMLTQTRLDADDVARFTEAMMNGIQKQAMPNTPLTENHTKIMRPAIEAELRKWGNKPGGSYQ